MTNYQEKSDAGDGFGYAPRGSKETFFWVAATPPDGLRGTREKDSSQRWCPKFLYVPNLTETRGGSGCRHGGLATYLMEMERPEIQETAV